MGTVRRIVLLFFMFRRAKQEAELASDDVIWQELNRWTSPSWTSTSTSKDEFETAYALRNVYS